MNNNPNFPFLSCYKKKKTLVMCIRLKLEMKYMPHISNTLNRPFFAMNLTRMS